MELSFVQKDRAAGSLLAMACGDALGAGYEFKSRVPFTTPIDMIGGTFGFASGEWTDDTSMAIAIAEVAATGADLRTEAAQDQICENWRIWRHNAKDIGIQTQAVINRGGNPATAAGYREAAAHLHRQSGRTAGNGSLMRTAPVALAYLGDRIAMAEAAFAISSLTHHDPIAGEACVLWCEAIRLSVLSGEIVSPRAGIDLLPVESRSNWVALIDEAEKKQPHQFPNNGWVVSAFQAAWSAVVNTGVPTERPELGMFPSQHLQSALQRAVRVDNDTDTVAAIAGQILGAVWGASAVPAGWLTKIHGYPGYSAKDLTRLAIMTVQAGKPQPGGWPVIDVTNYQTYDQAAVELRPGLFLSGQSELLNAAAYDVIVSLSRVGIREVTQDHENHLRVSVLDSHDENMNPNLEFQLVDVANFLASRIRKHQKVLLHCVHAQTRTPSFAVAYLMVTENLSFLAAEAEVRRVLPGANLHHPFDEALQSLTPLATTSDDSSKLWESLTPSGLWLETQVGWFQRLQASWQPVVAPEFELVNADFEQIAAFDEAEAIR